MLLTHYPFKFKAHSVNAEGLQRLILLLEGTAAAKNSGSKVDEGPGEVQQQQHGSSSSSSPSPSSLLGNALVSERHAYKYRCSQCSLAFKTAEKLALHSQYHVIRDATRCRLCSRSFRSIQALIRHVDESGADHEGVDREELGHYKLGLMNHPLLVAGLSGQLIDPSANDLLKSDVEENNSRGAIEEQEEKRRKIERLFGGPSGIVRKADKSLTYPLEKYLDPNRPYKCDVCKESFTQKNILLVHYNSVSHLHKLKKTMQESQQQQQQSQPPPPPPMHLPERGSLESAISNLRKDDGDEASKPYKCNICKVAYSQGSTLDIHIRSVLHQTRASKLQELALTGQIDLSRPLIEQPDPKLDAQKKTLTEMLSPKSLNSSGSSSNPQSSPPTLPQVPSSPGGPGGPTPHSSPLAALGMGQPPNQPGLGGKSLNDLFANQGSVQQSCLSSQFAF